MTDTHHTNPTPPETEPWLLTGVVLYSTGAPEADALLVREGMIAWIGQADSAAVLHPEARTVEATGCLVTPSFVDAAATADGSAPDPTGEKAAAALGITQRLPGPTGEREGMQVIAPVTETAPLRTLSGDGTPIAFGSAGAVEARDPWSWVRAAALEGDPAERLSDRAAFLAATRGGRRLAGEMHPGDLRTGSPATFVVWEPWDLTVRSSAPRPRESWSTDPRSRTPLLPDLDHGSPRALLTVVNGALAYDALTQKKAP